MYLLDVQLALCKMSNLTMCPLISLYFVFLCIIKCNNVTLFAMWRTSSKFNILILGKASTIQILLTWPTSRNRKHYIVKAPRQN